MQGQRKCWSSEEIEAVRESARALKAISGGLPDDSAVREDLETWAARLGERADEKEQEQELEHEAAERRQDLEERWAAWQAITPPERDTLALALIDQRRGLTRRELWLGLRELPGSPTAGENAVRAILNRLMRAGEVVREPEPHPNGPRFRYRYFLSRPLEGAIADLDQQFE